MPKSLQQAPPEAVKAAWQVRAQQPHVEECGYFKINGGGQELPSVPVHTRASEPLEVLSGMLLGPSL